MTEISERDVVIINQNDNLFPKLIGLLISVSSCTTIGSTQERYEFISIGFVSKIDIRKRIKQNNLAMNTLT